MFLVPGKQTIQESPTLVCSFRIEVYLDIGMADLPDNFQRNTQPSIKKIMLQQKSFIVQVVVEGGLGGLLFVVGFFLYFPHGRLSLKAMSENYFKLHFQGVFLWLSHTDPSSCCSLKGLSYPSSAPGFAALPLSPSYHLL